MQGKQRRVSASQRFPACPSVAGAQHQAELAHHEDVARRVDVHVVEMGFKALFVEGLPVESNLPPA